MENIITVSCKVKPGSSQKKIIIGENGTIIVCVHSNAKENEANAELKKFLSKILRISQSRIEIVAGEKLRNKILKIFGISKEYFWACLQAWNNK